MLLAVPVHLLCALNKDQPINQSINQSIKSIKLLKRWQAMPNPMSTYPTYPDMSDMFPTYPVGNGTA